MIDSPLLGIFLIHYAFICAFERRDYTSYITRIHIYIYIERERERPITLLHCHRLQTQQNYIINLPGKYNIRC